LTILRERHEKENERDRAHRVPFPPSDPRVATVENADKKDANPPLQLLEVEIEKHAKFLKNSPLDAGKSVIYWMRMNDLRGELDSLLPFPPSLYFTRF